MEVAGPIGKLKFPEDHAEWTRDMSQQGYARIAAENAAKERKKAEIADEGETNTVGDVILGDSKAIFL